MAAQAGARLMAAGALLLGASLCLPSTSAGPAAQSGRLRIGCFNIQVFGVSKMTKHEHVRRVLANITTQYDIMAVQEIRDAGGQQIGKLLSLVNALQREEDHHELVVSPRFGSTSSKEAYAFFYRKRLLKPVRQQHWGQSSPSPSTPPPSAAGGGAAAPLIFPERPPFSVVWRHTPAGNTEADAFQFETLVMHVDPDDVVNELRLLGEVARQRLQAEPRQLVMGDFNADCAYLPAYKWACIRRASGSAPPPAAATTAGARTCGDEVRTRLWDPTRYRWLVEDGADTTTKATDCAYDRAVVSHDLAPHVVPSSSYVDRFDTTHGLTADEAHAVSDHYPISLTLALTRCCPAGNFRGQRSIGALGKG